MSIAPIRIGVFGDSYAADHAFHPESTWAKLLHFRYGHHVTNHAAPASSLAWSAMLIEQLYQQYDLVIWCVTNVGRFSIPTAANKYLHTSGDPDTIGRYAKVDSTTQTKLQAFKDYLVHLYDQDTEIFIGKAIVAYHQQKTNVMIMPCFEFPLKTDNNLFEISKIEHRHYFPNKSDPDIFDEYNDLRPNHMCLANHEILAEMISRNLKPGILNIDLSKFVLPDLPVEHAFRKHKI